MSKLLIHNNYELQILFVIKIPKKLNVNKYFTNYESEVLFMKTNLEPPTEKQYDYAKAISEELDTELPFEFSKKAYSDYISNYQNQYKLSLQRYHDEEDYSEDYNDF